MYVFSFILIKKSTCYLNNPVYFWSTLVIYSAQRACILFAYDCISPCWSELCTKSRWWHLKVINVMYKRTHIITTPASWIEMCDSITVLLVTDVQIIRHFSRFRNKNVVQMQLTRKPDVFWEGSITLMTKPLCKQNELYVRIYILYQDAMSASFD